MTRFPSMEDGEILHIPAAATTLEGFRRWSWSRSFPEERRIDFLDGDLEIRLGPEDLYTHGTAKAALAAGLHGHVVDAGRGAVYVDCTRIVSVEARLSVEPDVVAVLWESLDSGRVREVPAKRRKQVQPEGRFIELEGAPDLVVEVVSDGSEGKDRRRLPPLYARAGVPEMWLADVRGRDVDLGIHHLGPNGYVREPAGADGWCFSRFLGCRCRLRRQAVRGPRFVYKLKIEG